MFDNSFARGHILTEFWSEPDLPPVAPVPTWASIRSGPTNSPYYEYTEYYADNGSPQQDTAQDDLATALREYYDLSGQGGYEEENKLRNGNRLDDPMNAAPNGSLSNTLANDRACKGRGNVVIPIHRASQVLPRLSLASWESTAFLSAPIDAPFR